MAAFSNPRGRCPLLGGSEQCLGERCQWWAGDACAVEYIAAQAKGTLCTPKGSETPRRGQRPRQA
jgi:hypothetical protein